MNKALLIGINNYPSDPLRGCVNDILDIAQCLNKNYDFQKKEIRIITDERATKKAIVSNLEWLVQGAKAGDRIVFHFSGHGVQMPSLNPEGEIDGLDEAICPYDFKWTEDTTIRDKQFKEIFKVIPDGTLFTWVSDSCHSGDLFKAANFKDIKFRTIPPPIDIQWQLATAQEKGINIKVSSFKNISDHFNVLLISGCDSHELSADARINGRYNGALTYYLVDILKVDNGSSMTEIIKEVNKKLDENEYDQNPQLQGSNELSQRPFLR